MAYTPRIVAHRGLHQHLPENSRAAFNAAWKAGIAWCECDIRQSRDGAWAVMHDATLDRTTTGSGDIARLDLHELQQISLKGNGEPIPTCNQVLSDMPQQGGLIIEIKSILNEVSACELLATIGRHRCELQSFDATNLHALDGAGAKCPITLLIDQPANLQRDYPLHWRFGVHFPLADGCRTSRQLSAWTANEPGHLRQMMELKIDTIITDQPLLAMQVWREFSARR